MVSKGFPPFILLKSIQLKVLLLSSSQPTTPLLPFNALNGKSGVVGWDEDNNNTLSCIDFSRIKGGKPFDTTLEWYKDMMQEIKTI